MGRVPVSYDLTTSLSSLPSWKCFSYFPVHLRKKARLSYGPRGLSLLNEKETKWQTWCLAHSGCCVDVSHPRPQPPAMHQTVWCWLCCPTQGFCTHSSAVNNLGSVKSDTCSACSASLLPPPQTHHPVPFHTSRFQFHHTSFWEWGWSVN